MVGKSLGSLVFWESPGRGENSMGKISKSGIKPVRKRDFPLKTPQWHPKYPVWNIPKVPFPKANSSLVLLQARRNSKGFDRARKQLDLGLIFLIFPLISPEFPQNPGGIRRFSGIPKQHGMSRGAAVLPPSAPRDKRESWSSRKGGNSGIAASEGDGEAPSWEKEEKEWREKIASHSRNFWERWDELSWPCQGIPKMGICGFSQLNSFFFWEFGQKIPSRAGPGVFSGEFFVGNEIK